MTGRPIPEELRNAVLQKLGEGRTQVSIAEELGITQQKVAYIQKRAAESNGRDVAVSGKTGTRAFISRAWISKDDANSWNDVGGQDIEISLAIDAAELAAAAWKEAASKLRER